MSYILDALRRAEAERGRGGVPGLHTQAMPAPGLPADRPGSPNLVLLGMAVVAVAALAAGGTWWAMQRDAGAPVSAPTVATVPPVAVPVPAPAPVPAPLPAAPVAASPVAAPQPSAPVVRPPLVPATVEPRPVAQKRVAEPAREPAAAAAPAPARAREAPAPQREPAPAVAAAAPAAVAAPNSPVFAQNELPSSVREQLPVLQVTGATYSSNPAHRMAIVNGQVLQEGDQAAPGLKLERIEQGRTVWSFRGYRYAVAPQ